MKYGEMEVQLHPFMPSALEAVLSLIKHHDMKMCGRVEAQLRIFLDDGKRSSLRLGRYIQEE
jgi:hypothetical protein